MGLIEKRKHTRIEARWPITVLTNEGIIEGETRNISVGGMYINCKVPLSLNESYRVSITPPNHQNIELSCKVVWSDLYGIGFCFVEVPDEDRHLLRDIISIHPK